MTCKKKKVDKSTWIEANLEVELAVETFTVSVDQLEGVRAIAVHVTVAIGQTSITEQERHLYGEDARKKTLTKPARFSHV